MLESQWLAKRDDELQQALTELDLYTPEAQRVILAESRRRNLNEQRDVGQLDDVGERLVPGIPPGSRHRRGYNRGMVEWDPADLFTPRGRISRLSYVGRMVGCVVGGIVLNFALLAAVTSLSGGTPSPFAVALTLLFVWSLTLWISVASAIKRCHDLNQSGYWVWLYIFVPFAGLFLVVRRFFGPSAFLEVTPLFLVFFEVIVSIVFTNIFAVLILAFRKGTEGPNRFGLEASTLNAESPLAGPRQLRDLFTTRGRISRLSYLGRIVGCLVFNAMIAAAAATAPPSAGVPSLLGSAQSLLFGVLELLLWLLTTWISIASGIKRCHDMNQSGYWLWLYLIPFVGLILVFRKGTDGPNRFDLETANVETEVVQDEETQSRAREGALDGLADATKPEAVIASPGAGNTRSESGVQPVPLGQAQASSASLGEASATELLFWDSIKASSNAADFQAYLERYPKGAFAALARNKLLRE